MTAAAAAPVHFDLDMKLWSGVEEWTPALTQRDNCEHMAACLIMVTYPPPLLLLRSGRSLGKTTARGYPLLFESVRMKQEFI